MTKVASKNHKKGPLVRKERDVTERDVTLFEAMISHDLNPTQAARITEPDTTYPRQKEVLAVHWHPEFVPVPLIEERVSKLFPNHKESLIIPTQHNILTSYGDYTGVEIDCYSPEFNRKVQLLFHWHSSKIEGRGEIFRSMLRHTFQYRAGQLWEFVDSLLKPEYQHVVDEAAAKTGADQEMVEFIRTHVEIMLKLIDRFEGKIPEEKLRNKILRDYFDTQRDDYDEHQIDRIQVFLKEVKKIVKRNFSLKYFYTAQEFIEEGRALGACVVIPHPEQFWPILMLDLDIDGIEVWNPQSMEYTKFLIEVVAKQNRNRAKGQAPLLVTMGDDCHFGEKVKEPRFQKKEKASREIGVQPPWDDLSISKSLIVANASRSNVIREYKERLA